MKVTIMILSVPDASSAESCLAPVRPFVPSDSQAARDYAGIIRRDLEVYITDIQDYGRFLELDHLQSLAVFESI